MSIKICVVTPTWKRPLIGTLFVQQLVRWKEYLGETGVGIRLVAIIVGSEEEKSRQMVLCSSMGEDHIYYLEFENRPLGRKFNAGIKAAYTLEPDYVMIMGDDAICFPTIFNDYLLAIKEGHNYIGVRDLNMWDVANDDAVYWPGYTGRREGEAIGSGRLIHSSILDGLEKPWEPYNELLNRNLDYSMTQQIGHPYLIDGSVHLMTTAKSENNITPMPKMGVLESVSTDRFYVLFNRY